MTTKKHFVNGFCFFSPSLQILMEDNRSESSEILRAKNRKEKENQNKSMKLNYPTRIL